MSLVKKISIMSLLLAATSCYDAKTHGKFITEHQDAWIDGYAIRIDEHEEADQGLVFCRANINEEGEANPVCFQPSFKKY